MSERLPAPDVSRFPDLDDRHVRIVDEGTPLARIFAAGGRHPTTWNGLRSFGPTSSRFDHQPPPSHDHPTRRVMYGAVAVADRQGVVHPTLKTCLAECFRNRGIVELRRDDPCYTQFRAVRPLRLLDLSDSDWVTHAGGNAALTSGPRSRARPWARAIYRRYPTIDGVFFASSNIPNARAFALWERAENALPARPSFNKLLADPGLRPAIETYAFELALDLDLA